MNAIRNATLPIVVMACCGVAGCSAADPTSSAGGDDPSFAAGGSASGPQKDTNVSSGGGLNLGGTTGAGGSGANGSSGGCSSATKNACSGSNAQCSDGNPCTEDVCESQGEFFVCKNTLISGCQGDPTAAIDQDCEQPDNGTQQASITIPYVPLVTPNLPASCNDGFEWQSGMQSQCSTTYVVPAVSNCGSSVDHTLYIDIATYTLGDRLRITAIGADDQEHVLLDTCRIRTWDSPDPTDGKTRPPDQTIRQFQIVVKAGTKSLTFDSTQSFTPWYMRVLGMCEFEPLPPLGTCAWRTASL
jgi:hypothetical protein